MTTITSPIAEEKQAQTTTKVEDIQAELISSLEVIEELITLHSTANTLEQEQVGQGIDTGPWKNTIGDEENIYYIIFNDPVFTNVIKDAGLTVFDNADVHKQYALTKLEEVKTLITTAQDSLTALSIKNYQDTLTAINTILTEITEKIDNDTAVLAFINNEISDPNSVLYKGTMPLGPFSTEEIKAFTLPPKARDVVQVNRKLVNKYNDLISKLSESISEDVLLRISVSNVNLTQSPDDPNVYDVEPIEEKDPWGIRFSYTKSITGETYIEQDNAANPNSDTTRANATLTEDVTTESENTFVEGTDASALAGKTVRQRKDFYFQLLPAIKSNLPVSAGTDVPGAMPGIQFRIENNIVKHKIPGFSPIYQPIGIDSIKCTLVGMFTGNDGVDISSAYSDDLNTGLLLPDANSAFGNRDLTNKYIDGTNTPIPAASKSTTSSNVAILAEDAFRSAQDFYNEIVATGREIEVELNMRKSSGPFPGGTPGPFRDEVTGNPKFKALIKKLDLYYVRRDRCWFILDLEITNSGLISNKCINLTNIIDQAVDLFEAVEEEASLDIQTLKECFGGDVEEIPYKNEKSGYVLVIHKQTGLSYEYRKDTGTLSSEDTYPTSIENTFIKVKRDLRILNLKGIDGTLGNKKKKFLAIMIEIINNATATIKTNPENKALDFAPNRLKILGVLPNILGLASGFLELAKLHETGYYAYNKNDGLFYLQDKNKNIEKNFGFLNTANANALKINKLTLKQIVDSGLNLLKQSDTFGDTEVDEAYRFFLDDYLPLLTFKPSNCENKSEVTANTTNAAESPSINTVTPPFTNTTPAITDSNDNIPEADNQTTTQQFLANIQNELNNSESNFNKKLLENLDDVVFLLQSKQPEKTDLTASLISVIKKDIANKKIYIKESDRTKNIYFLIGTKRGEVITGSSSLKEVVIKLDYDINEPATLIYNKKEGTLYPNNGSAPGVKSIKKTASIKLQYATLNIEEFKINSVNLVG